MTVISLDLPPCIDFPTCPTYYARGMAGAASIIGKTLGRYRIEEMVGSGGMGEVYRAWDERLERDVALKLLPSGSLTDENSRKRFRKEALTLSKLNHPNIETVHDFDSYEDNDFLVMELVPGVSLDDKIASKPIPEKEIVQLGHQIAQGLIAAHEQRVVHRDLKPGNIQVMADGRVKILDFGLAHLIQLPTASAVTASQTRAVAGTLPYMSPEQLQGQDADVRMDIWGFGVVLYEMATGKRPFDSAVAVQLTHEILHQAPVSPKVWNTKLSAEMERIILKCLEKEPDDRYQSAKELDIDLRRLGSRSSGTAVEIPVAAPTSRLWMGVAATAVIGAAAVGWILWRTKPPTPGALHYVQLTNYSDSATSPALSPDGRMLAFIRGQSTFIGPGDIYVKLLPDGDPVQLTHDPLPKMSPIFSPDGSRLAYSVEENRWDTWMVPVLGGTPKQILSNAAGLTWTSDRHLLFSEITRGLDMKVVTATESRGEERDVYLPPTAEIGMAHRSYLSPNGKSVLVAEMDNKGWLPCRLVPFDSVSRGEAVGPVPARCTNAAWSPDGTWMYFSADAGSGFHIFRQKFPDGAAEQLTFGGSEEEGVAVSPDAKSIVTSVGVQQSTVWLHDASGERQISSEGYAYTPAVSADGKKIYYLLRSGNSSRAFVTGELWVSDSSGSNRERLLPGLAITRYDVSADGKQVVFAAIQPDGKSFVWLAWLDRHASPRKLVEDEAYRPFFAPEGRIYFLANENKGEYVFRINQDGTGREKVTPDPVIYMLNISPDGNWIATWEADKEGKLTIAAHPASGGPVKLICGGWSTSICKASGPANSHAPTVSWSRDQKTFYFAPVLSGMYLNKSFVIPLNRGEAFPRLPKDGVTSDEQWAAIPGVRIVQQDALFAGPNSFTYALTRTSTQRNIYRIELPQ